MQLTQVYVQKSMRTILSPRSASRVKGSVLMNELMPARSGAIMPAWTSDLPSMAAGVGSVAAGVGSVAAGVGVDVGSGAGVGAGGASSVSTLRTADVGVATGAVDSSSLAAADVGVASGALGVFVAPLPPHEANANASKREIAAADMRDRRVVMAAPSAVIERGMCATRTS